MAASSWMGAIALLLLLLTILGFVIVCFSWGVWWWLLGYVLSLAYTIVLFGLARACEEQDFVAAAASSSSTSSEQEDSSNHRVIIVENEPLLTEEESGTASLTRQLGTRNKPWLPLAVRPRGAFARSEWLVSPRPRLSQPQQQLSRQQQ
jgi:Ca2+/Na+ antiporter